MRLRSIFSKKESPSKDVLAAVLLCALLVTFSTNTCNTICNTISVYTVKNGWSLKISICCGEFFSSVKSTHFSESMAISMAPGKGQSSLREVWWSVSCVSKEGKEGLPHFGDNEGNLLHPVLICCILCMLICGVGPLAEVLSTTLSVASILVSIKHIQEWT